MLGKTESYKIPEVKTYNTDNAIKELYRGAPTTNYGIRYKFRFEYTKI